MKATEIGAFEAKTHLSEILEKVSKGRVFYITKRGHPVAELRPVSFPGNRLRFGCHREQIVIHENFDDPIPEMKGYTE